MKGFVLVGIMMLCVVAGSFAQVTFHDNCEDAYNSADCANLDENNEVSIIIPKNDNYIADFERIDVIPNCSGAGLDFLSVESPRYFTFIAYSENIFFDLEINNIVPAGSNDLSESGGQMAILKDCSALSGIFQFNFCNGAGFPSRVHGDIDIHRELYGIFEIGCRYIVLLDGISGSGADYKITFTNYESDLSLPTLDCVNLQNEDCISTTEVDCNTVPNLCENSSFSFSSDALAQWGCVDYVWTLQDSSKVIDSAIIDTVDFSYDSLATGWYYYDLEAQHACDTISIIDSFYIAPAAELTLPHVFICAEDIQDFSWPSNWTNFNGQLTAGMDSTFMFSFEDDCKCVFNEYLHVEVSEALVQGNYDTLICNEFIPFVFNGEVINGPVQNYVQDLDGFSGAGCDSSILLNVVYAELSLDIQVVDCEDDSITIMVDVLGIPAEINDYTLSWTSSQGYLGSATTITIGVSDLVSLSVELNYLGQECVHSLLTDEQFVTNDAGDFSIPAYECYSSNDTIIITYVGDAFNNPALVINQLSSYTYDVVNNQWIFTGMTEDDEVLIEYYALINGICSSEIVSISCSLDCVPYDITLVEMANPICWQAGDTGINLEYISMPLVGVDGNVTWSDGNTQLSSPWQPVDNVDSTYTIYFDLEELGCFYKDTMEIVVIAVPELSASENEFTICQTESIELMQFLSFQMDVSTIEYTGDIENIILDNGDELALSWDTPGTKQISFSGFNDVSCPSNMLDLTIVVEEQFAEDIYCEPMGNDIHFDWLGVPCIDSYEVFINGVSQGLQADTFYVASGFPSETMIDIEIIPMGDCACQYQSLTTECSTPDCPDVNLVTDFIDTLYCSNDLPISLQLVAYDGGASMNNLGTWSGPLIDNMGFIEINQLSVGQHDYTFEYVYDSNCLFSANVAITIVEPAVVNYELLQPTCYLMDVGQIYMDSLPSTIESTIMIDNEEFEWNSLMDLDIGLHNVVFTDINGCVINYEMDITSAPEPNFEIDGETLLIADESYMYSISSSSAIDSITWSLNDVVLCSGSLCNQLLLNNFDSELMELCAVCYFSEGCFKEICIELRVQSETNIFIPNIFSPSADETNGKWIIGTNGEDFILDEVSVYDRWGNRVFYRYDEVVNGEVILWDGLFNGQPVVSGVYVYKIHYTDETGLAKRIVGDLTLLR